MAITIDAIRNGVIGEGAPIQTPFGTKPLIYADYAASGRSLSFVEDYIREKVLPYYANTHTETSFTGRQTGALRDQARDTIRKAVNANDACSVIFCGSGATAAIHKLIEILNLRIPEDLNARYGLAAMIPEDKRPVVFIGPYEHHSNELPWRESIATVVTIPLTKEGVLDEGSLVDNLKAFAARPLKIGSFSAASNVSGIKTNVTRVSTILHAHDALAFWDYAAAGPYVAIDMQGDADLHGSHLDAVFVSPHKFVGGPGTPGVLVAQNAILSNAVPAMPGGGTVSFVTPESHTYISDPEHREEGGTPGIVESIRAGLVFQIQQEIGLDVIAEREQFFTQRAIQRWSQHGNLHILGNKDVERLAIFSFQIKWQGKDLHYGFVTALLNDLFGIQARGGCSCAGPYGHSLLNLTSKESAAIESAIARGHMVLRPGWTRLSFNYFIDEACFEYLLKAVELIASHGWRLLPFYGFHRESGVWLFKGERPALAATPEGLNESLQKACGNASQVDSPTSANPIAYVDLLHEAEHILKKDRQAITPIPFHLPEAVSQLCWFARPQDSYAYLQEEWALYDNHC